MKNFAILALLAVAGVTVWKHKLSLSVTAKATAGGVASGAVDAAGYPSGVSAYTPVIGSQSVQQIHAAMPSNPYSVSAPGYAPAFGQDENLPGDGEMAI